MAAAKRWRLTAAGRVFRLVAALVIVALAVVFGIYGWWNARPTEQELRERAGLVGKRELLVGVIGDMPDVSFEDSATGAFSGFDIDIALMVAADLGFRPHQVRFLIVDNEDRETMRAHNGAGGFLSVDLVVASFSITEEREAKPEVSFSASYLRTELSVVTRTGHEPVQSLDDLREKVVCTLTTSTAQSPLTGAGVRERGRKHISECVNGVLGGEYEAVSTDAAILAGFVAQHPGELAIHDIGQSGQERWGINTGGNEELRKLVNLSLCKSRNEPNDKRWEDAFEKHLRVGIPGQDQDIAVDEQPEVPSVKVRSWPGTLPDACH